MSDHGHRPPDSESGRTISDLAEARPQGILRDLWDLLRWNKKWWLLPIIVVLLLVGVFLILASTAAAPFTYTLF